MGASINAATGKESTHLYARFLDTHTEKAFDLLSEMLLEPTYPEIDSERQVVIEEIAMYEDEPSDRVHDVLDEAVFGDHPLGPPRARHGRGDRLDPGSRHLRLPPLALHGRQRRRGGRRQRRPRRDRRAGREVRRTRRPRATGPAELEPPHCESRFGFMQKDTEQYHVCLGGPGIGRGDDRRFALTILDTVFGGSTSSRLFREVREKRGLAYAVGSYTQQFVDGGLVGLYVGTREDNVEEACDVIGSELTSLSAEGISEDELARAKESVKGRMVLSSESTAARMARIGKSVLFDTDVLTLDEMIAKVDAVTADEVAELADEFYAPGQALGRRGREGRGPLPQGAGPGQRSARSLT